MPDTAMLAGVRRIDAARTGECEEAARALAETLDVPFGATFDAETEADVDRIREHVAAAAERTVLIASGSSIARLVGARMRHTEGGPASVIDPAPGTCTSTVVTSKGKTFADYGAGRTET